MTSGHVITSNFTIMQLEGTLQLHSKLIFLFLAKGRTAPHQDVRTRLKKWIGPTFRKILVFSSVNEIAGKTKREETHIGSVVGLPKESIFQTAVRLWKYNRCLLPHLSRRYYAPDKHKFLSSRAQYFNNWLKLYNLSGVGGRGEDKSWWMHQVPEGSPTHGCGSASETAERHGVKTKPQQLLALCVGIRTEASSWAVFTVHIRTNGFWGVSG